MTGSARTARRLWLTAACLGVAVLVSLLGAADHAGAAVSCPNPNPVVNENQCQGAGSGGWQLTNYSENLGGFATQTSFNLGQDVPLKIGRNVTPGSTSVNVRVYRLGWYGGLGGRLVYSADSVAVNNNLTCQNDATTGKYDCGNWAVTTTIPGSALPASGVYTAHITATDGSHPDNEIVFVVRDDARSSKLIDILPTDTWDAYNNWGGKSLYFDKNGGANTISGTDRAVAVSQNRPLDRADSFRDRPFGPDFELIQWLERMGYDVAYTDDDAVAASPGSLLSHKVVVISGHSEYWSLQEFNAVKAARDAGVNIASFSSNTAYWKIRYEDNYRTVVCFKTVQGSGSSGSGSVTPNDWGPDDKAGTADDAVGADGTALTADDHPENSTTTFRDNGAPPGDPNAPPAGRVGPNLPENSLFGIMYVGDNDSVNFPITVPAGNANGEFAADRIWRNTGISTNTSTNIGTSYVGWEWDAVPTQAQYLAQQPAGVKRLTATNVQTVTTNSWLQDEGRLRANTPPPGQPGTVNAVKYTAPSGALVFSSGTMEWADALSGVEDPRIQQATYNLLSDMKVQPDTPMSGIVLDPVGSNSPPTASFTATPSQVGLNQPVSFDASASTDSDGSIVDYQWDLNGDGTFETDTGTNPKVTYSYATEGSYNVRLRVTDNGGATDLTVRTVTVIGDLPPVASFTATPNPVVAGQTVTFDGSASSDPDGTVVRYQWDLDGNGTYETDTGSTSHVSQTYSTAGTYNVGLQVTDDAGKTATTTVPLTVSPGGVSSYPDAVMNTPDLKAYWRLDESSGTTFADQLGGAPATATGGVTLGATGAVLGDPDTAASFDGVSGTATAKLDLSTTHTLTIEFWLKWNAYSNNDQLAMEFTSNFNNFPGGFLVDPNAPQGGGTFGVGIGIGTSRNTVYFARPTAGVWHHYAFAIDTSAAAASEITPYVDGVPVSYTKGDSGTGAGNFANSTLYLMSRGASSLFGGGTLDEVALYTRALSASEIAEHYASYGTNRRPVASYTMTPQSVKPGGSVTFDASGSYDPDGSVVKYEWDLNGDGTYDVSSTSPTVTHTYSTAGSPVIRLRVTDNQGGTDVTSQTLFVGDKPPTASFTATPGTAITGVPVTFDASASSDPDGTITDYKWDLNGDGTYETDTGTTPTASTTYPSTGTVTVGLKVTDDAGLTTTSTKSLAVTTTGVSSYPSAVLATPGVLSYWRLGEASGPTLADALGANPGTAAGATFGVAGAVAGDPNTALRFDGVSNYASAHVDLSGAKQLTIEFWLKWNTYANDDKLAFEFTPNFNDYPGGFLVDPDAPQNGGTFGVGIGVSGTRNNIFFARPSAGVWHHYAFVIDTTAPGTQEITPYVDGAPVSYSKLDSGTGAIFANSTLYFMSRAGSSLFGGGTLDEVALYSKVLTAAQIADHYASYGTNQRPVASIFATPNPVKVNTTVTLDASGSFDPDGTIVRYQWDLDGNGTYETDTGTTPRVTTSFATVGTHTVGVRVIDNSYGAATQSLALTVGDVSPTASLSVSPTPAVVGKAVNLSALGSNDPDGTIVRYQWDLNGDGTFETDTGTTPTTSTTFSSAGTATVSVRVTDDGGNTATATQNVDVKSATYPDTVLATSGLASYWRMEESSGTSLADSAGTATGTIGGGVTLGQTGALAGTPGKAASFDGSTGFASAPLNLSSTSQTTVEFWLKWNAYANNDALALEFTPNFNNNPGGFLVDPNSSTGMFAIGIGTGSSRTAIQFPRPSAGVWHYYAFSIDTTAASATQITPYVDGAPVTFSMLASGTGAGNFANSTLYFMSRSGSALFGAGTLDELAIYRTALPATTVALHYTNGTP